MLSIQNLSASIEGKEILHDLSYEFAPGKTYAILGPNGSGKSTLGNAILGLPQIALSDESLLSFDATDLIPLSTDARARLGLFLSFQHPLPLPGVSVMDLLRLRLGKEKDAMALHQEVRACAAQLAIPDELLRRSLHEGFSGGEKKKLEALQAALLRPRFALFDEIDTGVDVDALKAILTFLRAHLAPQATKVFITHSHKLLSALEPDEILIMKAGHIVKTGGADLAHQVETEGFSQL